jgi:Flp pilus assembly protein TadD
MLVRDRSPDFFVFSSFDSRSLFIRRNLFVLSSYKSRSRFLLTAGLALLTLALTLRLSADNTTASFAEQQKAYDTEIRKSGYNLRFGKEQPFLPSMATTANGQFLPAGSFPTAAYCGHCHAAAYAQWRESLHSNSFREPFYRKNVDILIRAKGIEYSRHCEGCHNPIALLSGAVTQNSHVERQFDADGITCSVCHSIQRLQSNYGLGSYVMGVPAVMVDAAGQPIPGTVPYDEIMAHPERHSAAVMKDFYRSPEFCGSCHKANLPKTVTNYKWLRAIGLYDEFQLSSFDKQSPLPFYVKDYQSCQDCHMKREAIALTDYGAKDGKLFSHRFLGGNTTTPFYYGFSDQLSRTVQFLRDQNFNVDLFALRDSAAPNAPLIAPWGTVGFSIKPGEVLQTYVVIQNKGLGHSLIPEQRDFFEAWVEFTVKDSSGREISHSGFLRPDGTLDPRAHSFTNRLVDKNGRYLAIHEIWDRRAVAYDATIQSGRSTLIRYEFKIPADAKGPLTVTARLNYRHFRQDYLDFALGKDHPAYPVVEMAARTRTLNIGENVPDPPPPAATPAPAASTPATPAPATPAPPASPDNPIWQRWNNYGIAMLDQQQYMDAVNAFHRVAELRPDYPDAWTNIGVASISWEKYDNAREALEKALSMLQIKSPAPQPTTARALYYMALVERNQGHLEAAVTDLEQVVAAYPKSRDARRELGFSYYQQHKYQEASEQYIALQAIDPDDLAAHYNLAIIYRRLGEKQKASEEAARFSDEKDDPLSNTAALEYLRSHPDVSNESIPFHVHSDVTPEDAKHPVLPPPGTGGLN